VLACRERLAIARKRALNRALHELRRPLQVMMLSSEIGATAGAAGPGAIELAVAALTDLDRELNGDPAGTAEPRRPPASVPTTELLDALSDRWRAGVAAGGRRLKVECHAGAAVPAVDPLIAAKALDNLVANSLEHARGAITVTASGGD